MPARSIAETIGRSWRSVKARRLFNGGSLSLSADSAANARVSYFFDLRAVPAWLLVRTQPSPLGLPDRIRNLGNAAKIVNIKWTSAI